MSEQLTFWDIPSVTFLPESADGASRSGLPDGPTTARSGRDRAPASVSAQPGNSADLPTSATCGPCSPISSASVALNLSLANRLKMRFATVGSIEYTQTWKEKATPSGRTYWAHTASERRTVDTASTGEPYPWPTTQANNTNGAGNQGRTGAPNLQTVTVMAAWPTAQTMDAMNVCREPKDRSDKANVGGCANLREKAMMAAFPTPLANDAEKRGELANDPRNGLPMVAQICAWPTATSRDWKDGSEVPNVPLNALLGRMVWQVFLPGQTGAESTAATGKLDGYRLNPYFSGWLMGFPKAWTERACGHLGRRRLPAHHAKRGARNAPEGVRERDRAGSRVGVYRGIYGDAIMSKCGEKCEVPKKGDLK